MSDTNLSLPTTATTTDVYHSYDTTPEPILEHEYECDRYGCECLLTDEELTNNRLQASYEVEVGLWD